MDPAAARPGDPEALLASLEPIGWKLGTDRMERLTTALGRPQDRFTSIHVVGTNGKSSTTRMIAALLEAHGIATGIHTSPHFSRWSERVEIRGNEVGSILFRNSIAAAVAAAARIESGLESGERVTQFELSTAAALVALATTGVDVGVIEAGLGGRLDATNVLPSRVTVLTGIGLDHTEWLGETEELIAAEKLAVLRPGSALVLSQELPPGIEDLAKQTADRVGAQVVEVRDRTVALNQSIAPGAWAPYLRRNLSAAIGAAEALVGPLDRTRSRAALQRLRLPGRMQSLGGRPPMYVDAAHNPDGAAALAEALEGLDLGPVVACLGVLADKDAAGIIDALAPALEALICTEAAPPPGSGRPGARLFAAAELAELARQAGVGLVEEISDPERAVEQLEELASAHSGVALCCGSHYLLGYAWTVRQDPNFFR